MKAQFSIEEAHRKQIQLSKHIVFEDRLPKRVRRVAGVDVAHDEGVSIAAAVVLDYEKLEVCEVATAECETKFPYVPTLLSLREMQPALASIRKLRMNPDIFMIDAHGFAHPYRCGFACELGLAIGKPTIGVAKSLLVGEPRGRSGDVEFLWFGRRIVGASVESRNNSKPVFVSVGHMVSLETAIEIVRHCTLKSRVPKPIWKAHEAAIMEKRKLHILKVQQKHV